MTSKTFISHSSLDQEFIETELLPTLEAHGIETWCSWEDIQSADEWEKSIKEGLNASDWFLVVLSANSISSRWVRAEVHWAFRNRPDHIIPVMISDCNPQDLHLQLSLLQYVDFRSDRESARADLLGVWGAGGESPRADPAARPQSLRDRPMTQAKLEPLQRGAARPGGGRIVGADQAAGPEPARAGEDGRGEKRGEDKISPARGWVVLPLLILVIGWTVGAALASYLSPVAGLTIAFGSSLVAVFMAAIISRRRLQARKALGDDAAYRKHLALRLALAAFVLISLFSFVISFTSTRGGQKFIRETYTRYFATENNENSNTGGDTATTETQSPLPPSTGYVSDFAGVIDGPSMTHLTKTLGSLEKRTGIEFAVATITSTGGKPISDYSLAVARDWGIGGDKGGLLLLVAVKDGRWYLRVSRQLQGDLPDDVVIEFERLMNEPFKREQYGEGISKFVDAVVMRLAERRGFGGRKNRN